MSSWTGVCVVCSVFTFVWVKQSGIACDWQLCLKDCGRSCMRHRLTSEFSTWLKWCLLSAKMASRYWIVLFKPMCVCIFEKASCILLLCRCLLAFFRVDNHTERRQSFSDFTRIQTMQIYTTSLWFILLTALGLDFHLESKRCTIVSSAAMWSSRVTEYCMKACYIDLCHSLWCCNNAVKLFGIELPTHTSNHLPTTQTPWMQICLYVGDVLHHITTQKQTHCRHYSSIHCCIQYTLD